MIYSPRCHKSTPSLSAHDLTLRSSNTFCNEYDINNKIDLIEKSITTRRINLRIYVICYAFTYTLCLMGLDSFESTIDVPGLAISSRIHPNHNPSCKSITAAILLLPLYVYMHTLLHTLASTFSCNKASRRIIPLESINDPRTI